jgi:hypothetical protein
MWDDKLIWQWSILFKCKSSSPSQMKIALVIAMQNAITATSPKQNNFSVLD